MAISMLLLYYNIKSCSVRTKSVKPIHAYTRLYEIYNTASYAWSYCYCYFLWLLLLLKSASDSRTTSDSIFLLLSISCVTYAKPHTRDKSDIQYDWRWLRYQYYNAHYVHIIVCIYIIYTQEDENCGRHTISITMNCVLADIKTSRVIRFVYYGVIYPGAIYAYYTDVCSVCICVCVWIGLHAYISAWKVYERNIIILDILIYTYYIEIRRFGNRTWILIYGGAKLTGRRRRLRAI
jgi:hypothetical protein